MEVVTSIDRVREFLDDQRRDGRVVGVVPTMGFLHAGHLSLMRRAVHDCDVCVTTIFVNPLQFAAGEDLSRYPRDVEGDLGHASSVGIDCVFMPTVDEMYPDKVLTSVSVDGVSLAMEGASRPTHFAGVATVVAKLFNILGPCTAYFGEKDFQQLAVVRRMVRDLSIPVSVIGCPTVREPDGLAQSSRNVYLSEGQRRAAPALYAALCAGADAILSGETSAEAVRALMYRIVESADGADVDYLEIADASTLEPQQTCAVETSRLFGAVRFGATRLIDNVGVEIAERGVLDV